jgi:hypothetical protein
MRLGWLEGRWEATSFARVIERLCDADPAVLGLGSVGSDSSLFLPFRLQYYSLSLISVCGYVNNEVVGQDESYQAGTSTRARDALFTLFGIVDFPRRTLFLVSLIYQFPHTQPTP